MCGLIAKAMDLGAHLVIVLTANSNALRNQTAARINRQILKADGVDDGQGRMVWSGQQPGHPFSYDRNLATNPSFGFLPCTKKGAASLPSSVDANEARMYLERTLQSVKSGDHKHAILVVKKETNNLAALREALEDTFGGGRTGRPNRRNEFSLVVIDDEQDNASSPDVEILLRARDPGGLPNHAREAFYCYHGYPDAGRDSGFRTTAFGYTATPQVVHAHPPTFPGGAANPFHSRRVTVLRHPGDDACDNRLAYPTSPKYGSWYCGGSMFYDADPARGMNGRHPPQPPYPNLPNAQCYTNPYRFVPPMHHLGPNDLANPHVGLKNSIMAFLCSAAIRMHEHWNQSGTSSHAEEGMSTNSASDSTLIQSMLVHTHYLGNQHHADAQMVSELLHGYPNNAGSVQSLNTLDIMSNLTNNRICWKHGMLIFDNDGNRSRPTAHTGPWVSQALSRSCNRCSR